jgi:RNA polymerase sigma factor (sigma-70 family)
MSPEADQSTDFDRSPGSVTYWIGQLQAFGGNDELQHQIWNRYFRRLAALARNHLPRDSRRVADEEDVALSVLRSFFTKLDQGRFAQLNGRAELWALLARIATYKAIKSRVKSQARKRGGGKVRGGSVFSEKLADGFGSIASLDPGPRELAEFNDVVRDLLGHLDETLKRIAQCSLEGQRNVEIAEDLGVSPRTVERKLSRIRSIWTSRLIDEGRNGELDVR